MKLTAALAGYKGQNCFIMPKWKYAYIIQLNLRKIQHLPWYLCKRKRKKREQRISEWWTVSPTTLLLFFSHDFYIHILIEHFPNTTLQLEKRKMRRLETIDFPHFFLLRQSLSAHLFDKTCNLVLWLSSPLSIPITHAHTPKPAPQSILSPGCFSLIVSLVYWLPYSSTVPHNNRYVTSHCQAPFSFVLLANTHTLICICVQTHILPPLSDTQTHTALGLGPPVWYSYLQHTDLALCHQQASVSQTPPSHWSPLRSDFFSSF